MTDTELIKLIQENPEQGIALAVDLYGSTVKAVTAGILRGFNNDEREEAWSDTFVKLWKNAAKFDPDKNASLKTYIGTIARTVSLDVLRKSRRCDHTELGEDNIIDLSVNVEDDYARKENNKIIHQTVDAMDEPDRTIFILRFFYAYSIKDIGEKLSLKPKKVENTLFRKKDKIKHALIEGGVLNG